jgi:hypothetical protein
LIVLRLGRRYSYEFESDILPASLQILEVPHDYHVQDIYVPITCKIVRYQ